jgi:hypothetical protein
MPRKRPTVEEFELGENEVVQLSGLAKKHARGSVA